MVDVNSSHHFFCDIVNPNHTKCLRGGTHIVMLCAPVFVRGQIKRLDIFFVVNSQATVSLGCFRSNRSRSKQKLSKKICNHKTAGCNKNFGHDFDHG